MKIFDFNLEKIDEVTWKLKENKQKIPVIIFAKEKLYGKILIKSFLFIEKEPLDHILINQ